MRDMYKPNPACDNYEMFEAGAQDRASPNVMGLASVELEIGISRDVLYSVPPLNAILGLDFLGRALSRAQVRVRRAADGRRRPVRGEHRGLSVC